MIISLLRISNFQGWISDLKLRQIYCRYDIFCNINFIVFLSSDNFEFTLLCQTDKSSLCCWMLITPALTLSTPASVPVTFPCFPYLHAFVHENLSVWNTFLLQNSSTSFLHGSCPGFSSFHVPIISFESYIVEHNRVLKLAVYFSISYTSYRLLTKKIVFHEMITIGFK